MNTFIIISAVVAVAFSSPVHQVTVAEDTLGNYKFDFDHGDQKKVEERKEDGSVSGSFSYADPDGHVHTIEYEAGEQGFVAKSADLPVIVADLPENIYAFNQHAKAFNTVQADPAFQESLDDNLETPINPEQYLNGLRAILSHSALTFVEDTPETAQAKLNLIEAHAVALGL